MANTSWPPIPWLWNQYREYGAWYSGDPDALTKHTRGFWTTDEMRKSHVAIASDIAALSSGLIFSGSPSITHENEQTDARLQEIMTLNGLYSRLLEAGELQSAFGGVYAKWNWNAARAKYPILRIIPADAGLPRYVGGILDSVTFWSVQRVSDDNTKVWRLQEEYTNDGHIKSALYEGTADNLGSAVQLTDLPETKDVKPDVNSGAGMLLATYIPNRLPNRLYPYQPYGRSDFEGLLTLFSALDEAYSSMNRDVRLGKTQVIVPAEYLRKDVRDVVFPSTTETDPKNVKWTFSKENETFVALNFDPDQQSGKDIVTFQPAIRAEDHLKVIDDIIRRIITLAGFAPQSAGLDIDGQAESGTALNVRERRSLQTSEAKKTYWWHALINIMRSGLALDKAVFNSGLVVDGEISVTFADNTQPDMATVADTLDKLARAGAVSTERKVRILFPDWSDEDVAAEVAKINNEDGLPDPTLGDEETDPPDGDSK